MSPSADRVIYYHVCPPLSDGEAAALHGAIWNAAAGRWVGPGITDGEFVAAPFPGDERADKRDETVTRPGRRKPGRSKREGRGRTEL